jgi:hypothetical protein
MNHYITPDNKTWGFNETQTSLIPENAVLIPSSFTVQQIPYLTLINNTIVFNQAEYDADQAEIATKTNSKASALAKLAALGLTQDEITALVG